jgi:hypothetical protein
MKDVVLRLEGGHDRCQLQEHKEELCKSLKLKCLGLASLKCTIA